MEENFVSSSGLLQGVGAFLTPIKKVREMAYMSDNDNSKVVNATSESSFDSANFSKQYVSLESHDRLMHSKDTTIHFLRTQNHLLQQKEQSLRHALHASEKTLIDVKTHLTKEHHFTESLQDKPSCNA